MSSRNLKDDSAASSNMNDIGRRSSGVGGKENARESQSTTRSEGKVGQKKKTKAKPRPLGKQLGQEGKQSSPWKQRLSRITAIVKAEREEEEERMKAKRREMFGLTLEEDGEDSLVSVIDYMNEIDKRLEELQAPTKSSFISDTADVDSLLALQKFNMDQEKQQQQNLRLQQYSTDRDTSCEEFEGETSKEATARKSRNIDEDNSGDGIASLSENRDYHRVILVFGKALDDNQVTVEYATRLQAVAQVLLKEQQLNEDSDEEVDSDRLNTELSIRSQKKRKSVAPLIICFCGASGNLAGRQGQRSSSNIAICDAGMVYFRHLCGANGIDLSNIELYGDRQSTNEGQAIQHMASYIHAQHVPEWLAVSQCVVKDYTTGLSRKRISIHFTLVSNEYHCCNINDIHHRSPSQSLLRPLQHFVDWPSEQIQHLNQNNPRSPLLGTKGIIDTSWSYLYAKYPYTSDSLEGYGVMDHEDRVDGVKRLHQWMGECYLLSEELLPLYVNLKSVLEEKEFFQRDNYIALAKVRREFVSRVETLYDSDVRLRNGLRSYGINAPARSSGMNSGTPSVTALHRFTNHGIPTQQQQDRDARTTTTVDVVLEGATLSFGRCFDLVRPAGLLTSVVPKADFARALKSLDAAMGQIRAFCDPDRALPPTAWGHLFDDDDVDIDEGDEEGDLDGFDNVEHKWFEENGDEQGWGENESDYESSSESYYDVNEKWDSSRSNRRFEDNESEHIFKQPTGQEEEEPDEKVVEAMEPKENVAERDKRIIQAYLQSQK